MSPQTGKKIRRRIFLGWLTVSALLIGWTQIAPTSESVSVIHSSSAGLPTPTVTLDPSHAPSGLKFTTTTAPTTTVKPAPVLGPDNPNDLLVIDRGTVYRVARTPLASQLLWIATHQ